MPGSADPAVLQQAYKDTEHLETPYVVKFHRVTHLSPALPVFTFSHPAKGAQPPDNRRYSELVFQRKAQPSATCHGFAGYFEAQLYGDHWLSTLPDTHTPGMFSWFSIYFPLLQPLVLPAGAPLTAHMWRCLSTHDVWYEWAVSGPVATHIHNPLGRSYKVGL